MTNPYKKYIKNIYRDENLFNAKDNIKVINTEYITFLIK